MPKKANLEDLAELRNRPGKMCCISLSELIWNTVQINVHPAETRRMVMEVINTIIKLCFFFFIQFALSNYL